MVVKTIFVIKHSFGSFEVDSISPVSETANDIRKLIFAAKDSKFCRSGACVYSVLSTTCLK